jgi:molybdopterin/thiamine biosynthesis adenylyltransferase
LWNTAETRRAMKNFQMHQGFRRPVVDQTQSRSAASDSAVAMPVNALRHHCVCETVPQPIAASWAKAE